MNRSDLLIDNTLFTELHALERDLHAFTTEQPTSGRSGVSSYLTETTDTWDLIETVGDDALPSTIVGVEFQVTYTASGVQPYPNINIGAVLTVNGTTSADVPQYIGNGFVVWLDGTNDREVRITGWAERDESLLSSATQYRWTFSMNCRRQVTLYFKARAAGSTPGTLSVVRTV